MPHGITGRLGTNTFKFFRVFLSQLLAFGVESRLLLGDDPFDRFFDVEILNSGQLLQRVPVVKPVATREQQRA